MNKILTIHLRRIDRNKILLMLLTIIVCYTGMAISNDDTTLISIEMRKYLTMIWRLLALSCISILSIRIMYKEYRLSYILLVPASCLMLQTLDQYGETSVGRTGLTLTALSMIFCYLILYPHEQRKIYTLYRRFLVLSSFIGILCYLLYMFNVNLYTIKPYYGNVTVDYAVYIDFKVCYLYGLIWPRLCGLFNEPGYLGTFLALAFILAISLSESERFSCNLAKKVNNSFLNTRINDS